MFRGMADADGATAQAVESAIKLLYSAYAESDPQLRNELLAKAVVEDVNHWTRAGMTTSRQALSQTIGESLERNNGHAPRLVGEVQTFQRVGRVAWTARKPGRLRVFRV